MDPETSKEYKILVTLRQALSAIVRDITPSPGQRHPLSENTMEDIKQCFSLIAAREKEITDDAGVPSQHRPRYVDDQKGPKVVQLHTPGKKDD